MLPLTLRAYGRNIFSLLGWVCLFIWPFALSANPIYEGTPLPDSLQQQLSALHNPSERMAWLHGQIEQYSRTEPPLAYTLLRILATDLEASQTGIDSVRAIFYRARAEHNLDNGAIAYDMLQDAYCRLEQAGSQAGKANFQCLQGIIAESYFMDHELSAMHNEAGLAICPEEMKGLRITLINNLVSNYNNCDKPELTISLAEEALALLDTTIETERYQWAWLHATLGAAYFNIDERQESLETYQKALTVARAGKARNLAGLAARNIGAILMFLEAPLQAIFYLKEAEQAYGSYWPNELLRTYQLLGKSYLQLDSLQRVEQCIHKMDSMIGQTQHWAFSPYLHTLEIELLTKQNRTREAIEKAEACLAHAHPTHPKDRLKIELLILENYLIRGKTYGQYAEDIPWKNLETYIPPPSSLETIADTLLNRALQQRLFREMKKTYGVMGQYYRERGLPDKALEMSRMVQVMTDSMRPAAHYARMKEATFEYEVQQRDQKLQRQKSQLRLQRVQIGIEQQRTNTIYTLIGTLLLLVIMGAVFLQHRIRLNRKLTSANQELRAANTHLQTQSQQLKVQAEQVAQQSDVILSQKEALQEELASRERELATREVLRHRNERLLEALEKDLKDLSPYVQTAGRAPLKEAKNKLKQAPRGTRNWETFREQFERIHPNFFQHLTQHHPKLSPVDLRQCAYIRLGMDKHEMANLLNLTTRGVESARYRIRKKMELEKGQSLDQYLQCL